MKCPHCGAEFGGQIPDLEEGAAAFCAMCDWNLYWTRHGYHWIEGDRDKRWWERVP